MRLVAFNLPEIARITNEDTLDPGGLGDRKRAVFCCIPDNDTSFNYIGVCMEGAVIVLACLIFSTFMSGNTPAADTSLSAVTMSWQYVTETIFNMMVLVGLVKGAERIVREMFGL